MNVQVSPHDYQPLRRWWNRGRCRACYVHQDAHPVPAYSPARPVGDKRTTRQWLKAGRRLRQVVPMMAEKCNHPYCPQPPTQVWQRTTASGTTIYISTCDRHIPPRDWTPAR